MVKRSSLGPLVLALSALGCSLVVACGDDDILIPPVGGSGSGGGGTGGSGAGTGGSAGSAGAGMAGEGGGGAGGTAGEMLDASMGGTGGSDPTDAGDGGPGDPDASAGSGGTGGSGGSVDLDAGADAGTCPDFEAAAAGIIPQDGQIYAISRVLFDSGDDTAEVFIRNVTGGDAGAGTNQPISDAIVVCVGSAACADVIDLGCTETGAPDDVIVPGEELRCVVTGPEEAEGEIGILNGNAADVGTFPFAYIQWDQSTPPDFVSAPLALLDGGIVDSLEDRAVDAGNGHWTLGATIELGASDNTLVLEGDTIFAEDFTSCRR